jgi:hypothetical protein
MRLPTFAIQALNRGLLVYLKLHSCSYISYFLITSSLERKPITYF